MKPRTFHGRNMADALRQVKSQLGPDAVILNTRMTGRRGLLGVGAREFVEITAAPDSADLPRALRGGTLPVVRQATEASDGAAGSVSTSRRALFSPAQDEVLAEIGALKGMVAALTRHAQRSSDVPADLYEHFAGLVQNEVAEELARELIQRVCAELGPDRLRDPRAVRAKLAAYVESMLPTTGPVALRPGGGPTIVALIGPTGVGKTTTIAKLAANFCLREHRKVGLITIDTYRIAAVEQLRTYARIIDVPLQVVMSPDELRDAVARLADRDLILIDTAGRSQRDSVKIQELKRFFATIRPTETHLVLSGTGHESVLRDSIAKFREVGVDRVIFTKLDEAVGFGVILSCLNQANAKLSYVTTGQDVPDDIRVAESRALAGRIVGVPVGSTPG